MSTLSYVIGRVFISIIFIASGIGKIMNVKGIADTLEKKDLPIPVEIEAYVGMPRFTAAGYTVAGVEVLFGALVLLGLLTRLSALVLLVFTAVTIVVAHDFWTMQGDAFASNLTQALKNLAIMGGLLLLISGPSDARREPQVV